MKSIRKKFTFLEHMGDALLQAYGSTLEEAFENAALAMFEVMTDTSEVKPTVEDEIEVEAIDKEALLYNWLEALLVKFEVDEMLFSKFKVRRIEQIPSNYKLVAKVWGEKFDAKKHPSKVAIKAVTYHQMRIVEERGKTTVKFLLDL